MSHSSAVTAICLLASCLSLPVFAEEPVEPPTREQLYVCGVGPTTDEGVLELTAVSDEHDNYTDLQFRAEAPGETPFKFPEVPASGKGNFFFSNTNGPDGYLVSIRFTRGTTKYRFYSVATPPAGPDDVGGGGGGLVITEADGSQRNIDCGESVYEFISYMHDAMSCDTDQRYGAAFCDVDNVPERVAGDPLP